MVKHSWKAYFRRQEETAVLAQRLCTTEEQLPRYSESENQEPDCKTTDQFLSNSEESKVNQKTESDKGNTRTEKMNFDQKTEFKKSDLVELLDIARDTALEPYRPPKLAGLLDSARGESFKKFPIQRTELPQCVALSIPFEKLSQLGPTELLCIARITPYQKLPKLELMKLSKLDLVDLLREARKEFNKRYSKPDSSKQVTRRNEGQPANTAHSSSQIENENDPLSQARGQTRREIGTTVAKSHELYKIGRAHV